MIFINTALTPEAAAQEIYDMGYRQTSRRHKMLSRVDIDDVPAFYKELGYDQLVDLPTAKLEEHYRRCNSNDKLQLPSDDADLDRWSSKVMEAMRKIHIAHRDREWAIANDPTPSVIDELRRSKDIERLARVAHAQLERAQSAEARLLNLNPSKSLYKILIDDVWDGWEDNQIELDAVEDALSDIGIVVTSVSSVFTAESKGPVPVSKVLAAIAQVTGRKVIVERYDLLDKSSSNTE